MMDFIVEFLRFSSSIEEEAEYERTVQHTETVKGLALAQWNRDFFVIIVNLIILVILENI